MVVVEGYINQVEEKDGLRNVDEDSVDLKAIKRVISQVDAGQNPVKNNGNECLCGTYFK